LICEKILEQEYERNSPLEVFFDVKTPKEATCKGVLKMSANDYNNTPKTLIYSGLDNPFESITYEAANNTDTVNKIVLSVEEFFKFFFELKKEFDFEDAFGVSDISLKIAKEELTLRLKDFVFQAIENKSEGKNDLDKPLEETLFFYPIIGAINNLARKISQQTSLN
jgi:hypothetical protein